MTEVGPSKGSFSHTRSVQILGVRFLVGDAASAVNYMDRMRGLLVVPAAPALVTLDKDDDYRAALERSDAAITDSTLMILTWFLLNGKIIRKISGLAYLRELLPMLVQSGASTFWIMPSLKALQLNSAYLQANGFTVSAENMYVSPMYGSDVRDNSLLDILDLQRPEHIIIAVGGGTQERLGLFLRDGLSYRPAIHCIGAAIGFLSGDQVHIPVIADRLGLGWLFRCISDPKRYLPRYFRGWRLVPLMAKFGSRSTAPG